MNTPERAERMLREIKEEWASIVKATPGPWGLLQTAVEGLLEITENLLPDDDATALLTLEKLCDEWERSRA